jgi:glycerol-3-phosphate acyltransferase PlsY
MSGTEASSWWLAGLAGPLVLYLAGSIPFGYLLGRLKGIDLRQHGSGNIGATNAMRVLGKPLGILAFVGDVGKGLGPLLVLKALIGDWEPAWGRDLTMIACGLAAILGHNYTPWLGFKGGKGIATSAGVLGALLPLTLAASLSLWIITVLATRYVSVGSIAASLSLPVATLLFYPGQTEFLAFSAAAGFLGLWRHRGNIVRLRAGTEPTIDQKQERRADNKAASAHPGESA